MVETVANGTTLSILRDTALTGRSWRIRPRITRNYRSRNEVVWNFRTGPVNHRLLAGHGWAEQYDHDITSASASSGGADASSGERSNVM